jgi:hypothetical protein
MNPPELSLECKRSIKQAIGVDLTDRLSYRRAV